MNLDSTFAPSLRAAAGASRCRRSTWSRALVAWPAVVLVACVVPGSASSGTYPVATCDERHGAGRGDAGFSAGSPRFIGQARCRERGLIVRHEGSRERSGRQGGWSLAVPVGTTMTRLSARLGGGADEGLVPELTLSSRSGSRRLAEARPRARVVRWSGQAHGTLWAGLRCARRSGCGGGEDAALRLRRILVELRDDVAPRLEAGGELLGAGSRRGVDDLELRASDVGSGVHRLSVEVNGRVVGARVSDCAKRGRISLRLSPCPARAVHPFRVDTTIAAFRQGPNRVRVCVADWAPESRVNTACRLRRVRVDNACPVTGGGAASRLEARILRAGRRDRGPRLVGRMLDGGRPASGREICVATRTLLPGVSERVVASVRTDSDGAFALTLPRGPNREIRVAHWPTAAGALERLMRVRVRAQPRLGVRPRRLRNGERVHFRVSVPGPRRDRVKVRIQARAQGRWVDVRSGRTSANGIARARYRFLATTELRHYRFRAVVPRQAGYPYLTGRSASRKVTVRPR